ncbi:MAG TPA: HlyD family secretion protein [Candidatus Sulfotelmatobacter sp.]|nr:HlyD family secretion protein [Candidatus Sulfotelmatobacter sp.]
MASAAPSPTPANTSAPAANPAQHAGTPPKPRWPWLKNLTPFVVLALAAAIVITVTRNWNAWEGGKAEQVTDDATVRGDLTPLSTKVAGLVRDVKVSDYQRVHAGDLLVELQDDDFQAQVAQATAAVAAAKAAIVNNQKQRELQDSRIEKALAGVDLAKAQIAAAKAGLEAVQADVTRTSLERTRQEALLASQAATKQHVETAVADEERLAAQQASRKADLQEAQTALRSAEIAVETERRSKDVLESQEQQLFADLQVRQAALTSAQVNLSYTKIRAPEDGTVGERQVRTGQLVSPGTQVLAFVPDTKWIEANYRETQLTNMKVGDPAEISIDAYPGKKLSGKVVEIAPASGSQFALLPPDNATGNYTKVVQRVPVKIALDDSKAAAQLRPGLSVIATVRTVH